MTGLMRMTDDRDDKLIRFDRNSIQEEGEEELVRFVKDLDIHIETVTGTKISGIIKKVLEDAILIYQPHRRAVIWVRRDQISMASNQAIWI